MDEGNYVPETDPILEAVNFLLGPTTDDEVWMDRNEALATILGNLTKDWEGGEKFDINLFDKIAVHCGWRPGY